MSQRDEHLDAVYAAVPRMACKGLCQDGCHSVGLSAAEAERIKERHGVTLATGAYLERGCPMLSPFGRCTIYADRPLVCRLWGAVPSMACPHGCEPDGGKLAERDGGALMARLMTIEPDAAPERRALAPCRPVDDAAVTWLPPWLKSLPPPQADATLMRCTGCGIDIWAGPRNKAAAAAGTALLVCYTCARPFVGGGATVVNVHPGKPDRPRR